MARVASGEWVGEEAVGQGEGLRRFSRTVRDWPEGNLIITYLYKAYGYRFNL